MRKLRLHFPSVAILGLGAAGLLASYFAAQYQVQAAWNAKVESIHAEVMLQSEQIGFKLNLIGTNLRTMSLLPSVRNISRHAENLDPNGKSAIQQIYNNLASQIAVSEVYILPANFNPQRLDPETGKFEEPIMMFDELIVDAGRFAKESDPNAAAANVGEVKPQVPEVESFEYEELARQAAVMREKWPAFDKVSMKTLPVYASEEVITCDNTDFVKSGKDSDRQGVMFSTPFYRESGELGGMVTAIIRSNAIRSLLQTADYKLKGPTHQFGVKEQEPNETILKSWRPSIFAINSSAIFDVEHDVAASDPQGPWNLETHLRSSSFYGSNDFKLIRNFFYGACASMLALVMLGLLWVRSARKRSALVKHNATHDPLTNLPNRRMMEQIYDEAAARVKRGQQAYAFYLDLDRFKIINDTLGHQIGDCVIRETAKRIKASIRSIDTVGRIGGDEFVIILQDVDGGATEIARIAERILSELQKSLTLGGKSFEVGASIGIAKIESDTLGVEEAMQRADLALFRAKSEGRGSYRFFDNIMDNERLRRQQLAADLKPALQMKQFELHYQLIVDAKSQIATGCEALLRWQHPELGLIAPTEFIPLAEETGAIHQIGEWVLNQACMDAVSLPKHLQVAVNISPVQLQNQTFALHVVNALTKSGLKPSRLELEFTETVFLSASPQVKETIKQLRQSGVRFALDDFGVGYSSLGYLKEFEFERIKLDRSFMCDIESKRNIAILRTAAGLGNSLGVAVTAEGVETQAQCAAVQANGCSEVQGYLFSRPAPLDQLDFGPRKSRTWSA